MNDEQHESPPSPRAGVNGDPDADSGIAARTHEAAEQLKSAAQARAAKVRQGIDSTKELAAKRVRKLGVAVRAIGENMRIDDEQFMARYADSASRRLDSVATYLSDNDARELMHDAEDFMRRKPAMFFGGALLVGLAAGRFLKSSRPQADRDYGSERPRGGGNREPRDRRNGVAT